MKPLWKRCAWVVTMAVSALGATAAAQGAAGAQEPLRTLDEVVAGLPRADLGGKVVDEAGKPVKKAEVFLYYARGEDGLRDRLVGKTKTGRKGTFRFEKAVVWEPVTESKPDTKPKYVVLAKHPKRGISFATRLEGDNGDDVTVTLRGPRTVKVSVQDGGSQDGGNAKRSQGVRVFLCDAQLSGADAAGLDNDHKRMRLVQDVGVCSGLTDETGRVELAAPQGELSFWAEKEGCVRGWQTGWDPIAKTITLLPSARISGKVTLEDGTPAPGAAVWYQYHGNTLVNSDVAVTDDAGNYQLSDVAGAGFYYSFMDPKREEGASGEASLLVDDLRPGSPFVGKLEKFAIKPGDALTKDLTLARGCVVAGRAVDITTGKPVPNMEMMRGFGQDYGRIRTDKDGVFQARVAPGTEVFFQWEPYQRSSDFVIDQQWLQQSNYQPFRGVVLKDMSDLVLKVKLWPVTTLEGRVVDAAGQGVKGASVYLCGEAAPAKSDDTGAFTLKIAPTDRDFDLLATTEDKTQAGLVGLKAGATEAIIPLEPSKSYRGEVVDTQGLPAGGLKFYLDIKLNGSTSLFQLREEPTSAADGTFAVEHLCPKATYQAWWSADDEDNRDYDYAEPIAIDLAKLGPDQPIRIEAKRYLDAMMGRVVNAKGEPIEGAQVQVLSMDVRQQNARSEQIKTNKNGEFILPRLAHGAITLKVSAEGYKSCQAKAASDSVDVQVVLRPGDEPTRCRVTVVDDDGKPIANAPVVLWMTSYKQVEKTGVETREARTDPQGNAEFVIKPRKVNADQGERVEALLGCDLEGWSVAYHRADLNEDADVRLTLYKGGERWSGRVQDQDGKPIPQAKVNVSNVGDAAESAVPFAPLKGGPDYTYQTDSEGRFALSRFSKRVLVGLQVSAPGFSKLDAWFDPRRPQDVFTLVPGGSVKGRIVVKGAGQTIVPVIVSLINEGGGQSVQCEIAADGAFTADGAPQAKYAVHFEPKRIEDRKYVRPNSAAPPTVEVVAGKTAEVTIELEEGIAISGTLVVKATGKPPEESAFVFVTATAGARGEGRSEVNKDDGTWRLYVPEGKYDLLYYCEGMQKPAKSQTLTVEKGKTYEGIAIEIEKDAPKM